MLTNLGFECVIRGLRIGKPMARASWPVDTYVYMKDGIIYFHDGDLLEYEYSFSSEEILAQDWQIRL